MVKIQCYNCHEEMEIKYSLEPEKGMFIQEMALLLTCPHCKTYSRHVIPLIPLVRKEARKKKPKEPNYIG